MVYKRGKYYWYGFIFNGKRIQESTKQGNQNVARNMEAARRTALAKGEVGIREPKRIPSLADFLKDVLLPWAETAKAKKPKSLKWFRNESRVLKSYRPLANARLDEINGDLVGRFAAWRLEQGVTISTVNSTIRMLHRALTYAADESRLPVIVPKLKKLPGENQRDHVLLPEEEDKYLAACTEPLRSVAIIMLDVALRNGECYALRWENIVWDVGANGILKIPFGKTLNAERKVRMTPRVRATLDMRWKVAGNPMVGWVFPARRAKVGHIVDNTIYESHLKAVADSKVRPFVLYALRHTCLTRLGEQGADPYKLMRFAGHSSLRMTMRYVHLKDDGEPLELTTIPTTLKRRKKVKALRPAFSIGEVLERSNRAAC